MEPVTLEKLTNLFGTIAQVSFGIAGLLFVALTIDEQRKKRWFDPKHVSFAAIGFLMVVYPGFVSLLGLIPNMTSRNLSGLAIFFYGIALVFWWIKRYSAIKETRAERSKWKWLQKVWDVRGDSIAIIIGWGYSMLTQNEHTLSVIGIVLVSSVFFSTLSIFSLFRNS